MASVTFRIKGRNRTPTRPKSRLSRQILTILKDIRDCAILRTQWSFKWKSLCLTKNMSDNIFGVSKIISTFALSILRLAKTY